MPTKIEWTDEVWNPVTGCSVVSSGCKNCYAQRLAGTRLKDHESRKGLTKETADGFVWTGDIRFNEKWLDKPLNWQRARRIFVCGHGDLFHDKVTDGMLIKIWAVMVICQQHTFQILTKRPQNMADFIKRIYLNSELCIKIAEAIEDMHPSKNPLIRKDSVDAFLNAVAMQLPEHNIFIGVSVEDQETADIRIAPLLSTPAAKHWVSYEPALEIVDFSNLRPYHLSHISEGFKLNALTGQIERQNGQKVCLAQGKLDSIIMGGESGPGSRPMNPDWARLTRDACAEVNELGFETDFFFKQWGAFGPVSSPGQSFNLNDYDRDKHHWVGFDGQFKSGPIDGAHLMLKAPKKQNGRMLDGQYHDEQPINQES